MSEFVDQLNQIIQSLPRIEHLIGCKYSFEKHCKDRECYKEIIELDYRYHSDSNGQWWPELYSFERFSDIKPKKMYILSLVEFAKSRMEPNLSIIYKDRTYKLSWIQESTTGEFDE